MDEQPCDRLFIWVFLMACLGIVFNTVGCGDPPNKKVTDQVSADKAVDRIPLTPQQAIEKVLELDKQYGAKRNEASRTASLSDAVKAYIADVESIDMSDCPEDFRVAFEKHITAWRNSTVFFDGYPDQRGEMHVLFNAIRAIDKDAKAGIEEVEKEIWGTWAEVEQAKINYQ